MLFSFNWLNDYLEYAITPQKLAEFLTTHSFEVESITKKDDDAILDIAVLANRGADSFSHQGIAREANALLRYKGGFEKKSARAETLAPLKMLAGKEIDVDPATQTPLYCLAFMDNVSVSQSPDWLKRRLQSVGLEPINNIVDIANFVMLDAGQPLHVFDAQKLTLPILVRRAKDKERILLLGGESKELTVSDIIIVDKNGPLALAGIKGGQASAVTNATRSIAIEAAQFDPGSVYQSSKRLGLATDASRRFSCGFAPEFTAAGLTKAIALVKELAGGQHERVFKAQGKNHSAPSYVLTSIAAINQLLGSSLAKKEINSILECLGFSLEHEGEEDVIKVTPPFWRRDIALPADIIEEVGRVYGLENIPPALPRISLQEDTDTHNREWYTFIRTFFVKHGFSEVYTYSLGKKGEVELLNPISSEKDFLRQSIIPGLLSALQFNQRNHSSSFDISIFELGHVFEKAHSGNGVNEKEMFACAISRRQGAHAFWELKGYVEDFLSSMGFDGEDYALKEVERGARLFINNTDVGFIGLPEYDDAKLKGDIFVFECDIDLLIENIDQEREFQEPPRFPAIIRDVSLFLPQGKRVDEIASLVASIGGELIEDVELFDIFEQEGEKMRSLAFHIIYRSKEKTLTDNEVNALHQKIEHALKVQFHAQVR